jgi:sulfoxide reductase catalytic subunit YedY
MEKHMLIKSQRDGFIHPYSSEITPQSIYRERRDILKLLATGVAGAALASWAGRLRCRAPSPASPAR